MANHAKCAISVHCRCGGKMRVSAPVRAAMEAKRLFWKQHDGPGHGPCDGKTCNKNRAKAEAAELQESLGKDWQC